eukprot:1735341-Pleurochrysis_carterae.AAC.1
MGRNMHKKISLLPCPPHSTAHRAEFFSASKNSWDITQRRAWSMPLEEGRGNERHLCYADLLRVVLVLDQMVRDVWPPSLTTTVSIMPRPPSRTGSGCTICIG